MDAVSASHLSISLGWTPLHCAIEQENATLAKKLIEEDTNVNTYDNFHRTPLSIAASKGNLELTKSLLEGGAEVNRGFPLHYSCEKGHVEIVQYLITKGADVNLVKDNNYPLIIAATNGHLEVVQILVENGADVNVTNETKATALHAACQNGNPDLVTFLINSGCDVDAVDKFDITPLLQCLIDTSDKSELVKILLAKGAFVDRQDVQNSTALHSSSNPVSTLELIKYGANTNARDIRNETPLYSAVENKNTNCAKILLEHHVDPNVPAGGGWTALHLAAKDGNLGLVQELWKRNGDVNAANTQNVIPLHLAAKNGHLDVVKELIKFGSLINVPLIDVPHVNSLYPRTYIEGEGSTPLSLAKLSNHQDIVLLLSEAETNKKLDWPRSHAVTFVRSNNLDAIKDLSLGDAALTSRDLMGWTLLHHSVYKGFYEMSSELIKKGLSVNALDKFERTPLSIAAARNDARMIELLVDKGANVNLGLPLHYAIEKDAIEAILELIEQYCDVDIRKSDTSTALIKAASDSKSAIVKILLVSRADPNEVNKWGQTALHNSCQFNDMESVRTLLDYGAEVNAEDNCKDIPLICATLNSSYEVVKLLMEKGADIHWRDWSQWTPLHRAVSRRNDQIVLELIKAGADVNYFNDNVESPLYLSASHPKVLKVLLENHADVNFRAFGGWTPLHQSALDGNLECVKQLLEHGINVNHGSAENVLPIYLAAIEGHTEVVEELLKRGSYLDPAILDVGVIRVEHVMFPMWKSHHIVTGNTPLIGAASKGHLEVVRLLHSNGANLDAVNAKGNTALHESVLGGFENVVEFLLGLNVAFQVKNKDQKTALDLATENLNEAIVNMLKLS